MLNYNEKRLNYNLKRLLCSGQGEKYSQEKFADLNLEAAKDLGAARNLGDNLGAANHLETMIALVISVAAGAI